MTNLERLDRCALLLALVKSAGDFPRVAHELGVDEGTLRSEVSNVGRAAHLPPARNKLGALAVALIAELGDPEPLLRYEARKHGFLLVPEPRGEAGAAAAAGGAALHLQRAVSRIGEAFAALDAAQREGSDGGVRVTAAEWASVRAVAREGMEALAAAVLTAGRDQLAERRAAFEASKREGQAPVAGTPLTTGASGAGAPSPTWVSGYMPGTRKPEGE